MGFDLSNDTALGPKKALGSAGPVPPSSSTVNPLFVADLIAKQVQSLCLKSDASAGINHFKFHIKENQIITYLNLKSQIIMVEMLMLNANTVKI